MNEEPNWTRHYKSKHDDIYLCENFVHHNGRIYYCEETEQAEVLYSGLIKSAEVKKL